MKPKKMKYIVISLLILNALIYFQSNSVFADQNHILGRVVFSDDLSPVNNCNVKLFIINETNKTGIEIDRTLTNSEGEFKLSEPPQTADGIKIMAYPNQELDNIQILFEQKVMDYKTAEANKDKQYDMIIEVQRVKNNQLSEKDNTQLINNELLKQNFPNPFNPSTSIRFELPVASKVTLKIYSMNGANVATLVDNQNLEKGMNEFKFYAGDLPSGIYIYRLKAGIYSENKKMILIK